MKSKEPLKNDEERKPDSFWKKYKSVILISAFAVGIALLICQAIFCIYNKQTEQDVNAASQLEQELHAHNEIKKDEKAYNELCSDYNAAVDAYNQEANRINGLLSKARQYVTEGIPGNTSLKRKHEMSYEDYQSTENSGKTLETMKKEIEDESQQISKSYNDVCQRIYFGVVSDYNKLAKAYNQLVSESAVYYVNGLRKSVIMKYSPTVTMDAEKYTEDDLFHDVESTVSDTSKLLSEYAVAMQIRSPDEQWVIDQLKRVKSIREAQAVTEGNDPNGLLTKDGGYQSCIYFTITQIDPTSVDGSDIVAKGTDAGGAIEVYSTLEDAKSRCEYLSQFDDTLLYSGSYVLVGTMVIRTSYKLSNQEQVDLTDEIVRAFTELKNE